jgi:hypothetical protein
MLTRPAVGDGEIVEDAVMLVLIVIVGEFDEVALFDVVTEADIDKEVLLEEVCDPDKVDEGVIELDAVSDAETEATKAATV